MSLLNRITAGWNAFRQLDKPSDMWIDRGITTSYRPDFNYGYTTARARGLINPIYNRIAMDVADVPIKHVRVDNDDTFIEEIEDEINDRLQLSANLDQTGREFIHDVVYSMFDEGVIAVAPIDVDSDPNEDGTVKIYSWRCGRIVMWAPDQVQIELYDERTGQKQQLWFRKEAVAILTNPFFEVMNAPNSVAQRLLDKMAILDKIDSQAASGKLDLIIQLPYTVKSQARIDQARMRRNEIIEQLTDQKYGIAYTDGTEKITQLNRPIENNLPNQIETLWKQLYDNLYMTPEIMNGTANEQTMTNYFARVVAYCLDTITDELNRKFLTKTARSQGQRFKYYKDYFKLVPIEKIPTIADAFTRNAILSSNEVRQMIGYAPVDTAEANELRNKNLNPSEYDQYSEAEYNNDISSSTNDGYTDEDYGFH